MQSTDNSLFVRHLESRNYGPEDLRSMRHAFHRACDENPLETDTDEQRTTLAQAIVSRYERGLSEQDLIFVALLTLH